MACCLTTPIYHLGRCRLIIKGVLRHSQFHKNHEVNPHHVLAHHPGANAWWRHQMETFSALLALCEGNPPVTGGPPSQRPVTRRFDVFFDLRLNKRLSKQSRRRWFETQSRSLWRHCDFNEHAHFVHVGLLSDVPYSTITAKHSGWSALRLFFLCRSIFFWHSNACTSKIYIYRD